MSLTTLLNQKSIPSIPITHTYIRDFLHTKTQPKSEFIQSRDTFALAVFHGVIDCNISILQAGLNLDEYLYFCAMARIRKEKEDFSEIDPLEWIAKNVPLAEKRMNYVRSFTGQLELEGTHPNNPYPSDTLYDRLLLLSKYFPELESRIHMFLHTPANYYTSSEKELAEYEQKLLLKQPVDKLLVKLPLPFVPKKTTKGVIPEFVRQKLQKEKLVIKEASISHRIDYTFKYILERPSTNSDSSLSSIPVIFLDKWFNLWKKSDYSFLLFQYFSSTLYSQYDKKTKEHVCSSLATTYSPSEIVEIFSKVGFLYSANKNKLEDIFKSSLEEAIENVLIEPSIKALDPFFIPSSKHKNFLLQNPRLLPSRNLLLNEDKVKQGLLKERIYPISQYKYDKLPANQKELYIPIKKYNPIIHHLDKFVSLSQAKNTLRSVYPFFEDFLKQGRG